MTRGAGALNRGAGMRLMAIGARAVSRGGRRELLSVTALAVAGYRPAVGLMARAAHLVPGPNLSPHAGVAGRAGILNQRRLVRQPAMAALACRVPGARSGPRQLRLMTALTELTTRSIELEVMRSVTTLTAGAAMERALAGRVLVTAAASSRAEPFLPRARVSVVTRRAGVPRRQLRVIGMFVPVAVGAGLRGRAANVVGPMTAGTNGVCRHLGLRQHDHLGVTRAARARALRLEGVRLMTTHTLRVTARKQRGCGHERLLKAVALGARAERVRCFRVLLRVTGRTHSLR